MNEDIDFEYGEETSAVSGCGATLFGQFWYFGGYDAQNESYKRQVRSNICFEKNHNLNLLGK